MKLRLIAVLAFGWMVAGTTSSYASRQPDARESAELIKAISTIRQIGNNPATVDTLTEILSGERLMVEDSWGDDLNGETNYPIFGGPRTITINAHIIPDPSSRIYTGRFGPDGLFEDRTWLASVMVHEYLHTTQSYWEARFGGPNKVEPPAWGYQLDYVQHVCATLTDPAQSSIKTRCEGLEDRVQAEIDLYNGNGG